MLTIVGLSNSVSLAEKIYKCLSTRTDNLKYSNTLYSYQQFSDGEIEVSFTESIRDDDVYLIGSTTSSDSILELLLAIDAAKHASARKVIAVIPYFGYGRQDRKSKPRVSVGAKVLAKCIESAGADRVVTIDLHAAQEQCFFDIPVDHVPSNPILIDVLGPKLKCNSVLASPDAGAAKKVEQYAKSLSVPMVICHKHREKPNEVASMMLIGDVKNKEVFLIDDMIDTGGTICKAASLLVESGAKSVSVLTTHGVFSGPAVSRLAKCPDIEEVIYTDTIQHSEEVPLKFHEVTCSELLSNIILSIYYGKSISKHLE